MKNSNRGIVAEKMFETVCLSHGLALFEPVVHDSPVDLVVSGGKLYRCQIKVCSPGWFGKTKKVNLRRTHYVKARHRIPYKSSEIDVLVGVDIDTRDIYIVPMDFLEKNGYKRAISVSVLIQNGYINNFNIFGV